MGERDLDKNPYSPDEQRVAAFFFERGLGGGDDPIGSILASHQYLADQRKAFLKALEEIAVKGRTTGYGRTALRTIAVRTINGVVGSPLTPENKG